MEKKKVKIIIFLLSFTATILFAWYFMSVADYQAVYEGLPTAACINTTQKIVQDFSFSITIYANDKKILLDPNIGHDYGNCLHEIFTNDDSGTVHITSNTHDQLTLGQFFDTWKKTFDKNQIFQYQTNNNHQIKVFVNNTSVETFEKTLLQANQKIVIIYN